MRAMDRSVWNMKILLVDDEENIRHLVRLYLADAGYQVIEASSGQETLEAFRDLPDLIILDIGLPDADGRDVLREIRKTSQVPIIVLTAKDSEIDKVLGLELGADDYVTKPFSPRELVSRVRAVLRRSIQDHADSQPKQTRETLEFPGLSIDREAREITANGKTFEVPPKEFELLWLLASNPNRVFTREYLLEKVWGYDYFGDMRTVDVHIRRLRQKIEKDPENPEYIRTARGVGYKFEFRSK